MEINKRMSLDSDDKINPECDENPE